MRLVSVVDEAAFIPDLLCQLCRDEPYTMESGDGVKSCEGCAARVLDGIAEATGAIMVGPNRFQRRAMKAGFKRRKGFTR